MHHNELTKSVHAFSWSQSSYAVKCLDNLTYTCMIKVPILYAKKSIFKIFMYLIMSCIVLPRSHLTNCFFLLIVCDLIQIYPMTSMYVNVTWAWMFACQCVLCAVCLTGPHGRAVFVLNGIYHIHIYMVIYIYIYIQRLIYIYILPYISDGIEPQWVKQVHGIRTIINAHYL